MKKSNILSLFVMVPLVAVLAAGTIVEKFHDNEYATTHIYGAWWFYILLALVGCFVVYSIVKEKMWHSWPRLLLYSSVVFLLVGGALTAWTGQHGSITLHPGVRTVAIDTGDGNTSALPFEVELKNFEVVPYPGTHTPMDFVSHVIVEGENRDISMNNILKHRGYRFYQEDYGDDGSSVLSVAYDPWGIAVTYIGYVLMALGIIGVFVSPRSRFRQLAKGAAVVLMLFAFNFASAAPRTLPKATADKMGQIYVLYKGRVCPMQTLAKDFTTKLSGNARYDGLTPEQVLSGWMFYYADWADVPMIKIKGDDVKAALGTDSKRVSFNDFLAHREAFEAPKGMPPSMGGAMPVAMGGSNIKTKTMRAASEKFNLVQMLLGGKFVKQFPVADSTGAVSWYAQNDELPFGIPDDDFFFIRKQLSYCQELVVEGNFEELERVFDKTIKYQQQRAGEVLPTQARFRAERLYNSLTTGRWLAMLAVTLGLVFFALAIFTASRNTDSKQRRWNLVTAHIPAAIVLCLTLFLLLIFVLRWVAGGHIPMAGGFDSMNLTAIVAGIVSLAMARRYRMAPSIGLLAMGFCQLVAMMSGSNPPVTHLMPVLSSPLLTLHVTVIMLSYALFFFISLNGLAALFSPSRAAEMRRVSLLMLYPAVALLAIGIVIGALWANISWGNYWSWDPKEVWALITLIVYIFPLIGFRDDVRPAAFHTYCFLAFLSVIITYFGVNFILGGIHAYN